ncbi:hypothetical protein FA13DRAFT_1816741 [Coprinellus micaceus]|uniref:MYND-type domain-containing protein n=1 Tax=Coprinellus micaceus TaxID=71717 RepID=A0A4Y7SYR6_COPMI|nr:hypothetical protein FA13DRAFT_1816741 [Coprinellus micaceus]
MPRKPNKRVEYLVQNVQRGSIEHLEILLEDWPEGSTILVAEAALSLLTVSRKPQAQLDAQGFEIADTALRAVARAIRAVEEDKGKEDTRSSLTALLLPSLDSLISWMSLCARRALDQLHRSKRPKKSTKGEETDIENPAQCILLYGGMMAKMLRYDDEIKEEIQSSLTAAEFVLLLWTWTEKDTGLPIFMLERDPDAVRMYTACAVHQAFLEYVDGSEHAKTNVLYLLANDKDEDVGATRLMQLGLARLQRMRLALEKDECGNAQAVGRNIRGLFVRIDEFIKLKDRPEVLRAFHEQSFLEASISVVHLVARHIRYMGEHRLLFQPMNTIVEIIKSWSSLSGRPSLDAMRGLVENGLVDAYVEIIAGIPYKGREAMMVEEHFESICLTIVTWISSYAFHPLVCQALMGAFLSIDIDLERDLDGRGNHWTRIFWDRLRESVGLAKFVEEAGAPKTCDHLLCASEGGDGKKARRMACSGCHAVIYCSTACQALDWDSTHRDDCMQLRRSYFERQGDLTWIHSSTRLHHFSLIQEVYRTSAQDGFLETTRKKNAPTHSALSCYRVFQFWRVPFPHRGEPYPLHCSRILGRMDEGRKTGKPWGSGFEEA